MKNSLVLPALALGIATAALALHPAAAAPSQQLAQAPLAKASCTVADRSASADAPTVEWPEFAKVTGATGTALVAVTVGERAGKPLAVAIEKSSGDANLDKEALRVARETIVTPALTGCRNTGGTYGLIVNFTK